MRVENDIPEKLLEFEETENGVMINANYEMVRPIFERLFDHT
jgi:hypothetical protein